MKSKSHVVLVPVAVFFAAFHPTASAEHAAPLDRRGVAPATIARAFVEANEFEYGLSGVNLIHSNTLTQDGLSTVRFLQFHQGLRVLGKAASLRIQEGGRVSMLALEISRDIAVSTEPSISRALARKILETELGPPVRGDNTELELVVLPDHDGTESLAWLIERQSVDGGSRLLMDAHSGRLGRSESVAVKALGRVYPISSVVTPVLQDVTLPDLGVTSPQLLSGWSDLLTVTNYISGNSGSLSNVVVEQVVEPNAGSDFLFDPPFAPLDTFDAFAQVGLYYHLSRMRDFFSTDLGIDMTSPGWSLAAVANMQNDGVPIDDTFFSPLGIGAPWNKANIIAVGQGSSVDFAYDSDIILHEFTHYVSSNAVGYSLGQMGQTSYGHSPFSGSIDEGIADYFACSVNGDAILGEASLATVGSSRDLSDTSKVCPHDMVGEVHGDGEIVGAVSWAIRQQLGSGAADQLIWGAVSLLLPGASLGDFGLAVLQTANDMVVSEILVGQDVLDVEAILNAQGVIGCFPELEIAEGQIVTTNLSGFDMFEQLTGADCSEQRTNGEVLSSQFHFKATPNIDDTGIRVVAEMIPEGGADLLWTIFARRDDHVAFSGGDPFPQVSPGGFDYVSVTTQMSIGELVIDSQSSPAFDPTSTYSFVVVHQNCATTRVDVRVEALDSVSVPGLTPWSQLALGVSLLGVGLAGWRQRMRRGPESRGAAGR